MLPDHTGVALPGRQQWRSAGHQLSGGLEGSIKQRTAHGEHPSGTWGIVEHGRQGTTHIGPRSRQAPGEGAATQASTATGRLAL